MTYPRAVTAGRLCGVIFCLAISQLFAAGLVGPASIAQAPSSMSKQEGRGQWLEYGDPDSLARDTNRLEAIKFHVLPRGNRKLWWSPLGPDFVVDGQIGVSGRSQEVAGRVISLAVPPNGSMQDFWLAGAAAGGIWRTEDGGQSWMPTKMPGFPQSLAVGAIAFGSGDAVYAGTGDTSTQGLSGSGLLISVDSGKTWQSFKSNLDTEGKRPWLLTAVTGIVVGPRGAQCRGVDSVDSLWVAVARAQGFKAKDGEDETKLGLFYLPGCRKQGAEPEFIRVFDEAVSDLRMAPPLAEPATGLLPPGHLPRRDCVFSVRPNARMLLAVDRVCPNQAWAARPTVTPIGPLDADGQHEMPRVRHAKLAASPKNGRTLYLGIETWSLSVLLLRTDGAWDNTRPDWHSISFDPVAASSNPKVPVGYCNWDPASATPQKSVCHHANVLTVSPRDPDILFAGGVALWECRDFGKREGRIGATSAI